ncbi:hypothetical protein [Bifidobacterium vansinderenii]|uniref:Uncharacterized protein n=1 Tax=Bifidobacterium vansinderenii TaxID=1984871 RepID=A0A229W070_9BIFI|nr:hypothetical protein [Bifidobacterium vansinderenii]OXN01273.1 hypothetical protein Tam10B_0273 [Bifidobacterium vansinderenii]
MSHDFRSSLPIGTTFRSITGYLYAYDGDNPVDDSQETAWFSGAVQHDSDSRDSVEMHIADAVKQSMSKRDQLRSQLRLLAQALPEEAGGPLQLFNRYGFTDSGLPEDALYIAQFRMDVTIAPDGSGDVRNGIAVNDDLPDTVLAGTRKRLSVFARYAASLFDTLDPTDPTDGGDDDSDESQSLTLAVLAAFDSVDELDDAIATDDSSPMTAFRMMPNDDGSIHIDTQWYETPDNASWLLPMGFDFYDRLVRDLPDGTIPSDSSYTAYACFSGSRIPDRATPVAWFFADHDVRPAMLRCLVKLPEDQESFDMLVLLRQILATYTTSARQTAMRSVDE